MAEWIEPIFDRTQADVDYAIAKLSELREVGGENNVFLKGACNYTDFNRIEGNIQYLRERLNALYYYPETETKTWNRNGLPNTKDISRIIDNIQEIIAAFFQDPSAPELPDNMLTYKQVNDIEENLYLLLLTLNSLEEYVEGARQCGTFECGEDDL